MSNSGLVNHTNISPMKTAMSGKKNRKITVHHMAGNLTVEQCGNVFRQREASANYGIGSDGRVGLYVDEGDRSWASSSSINDSQAVTIEVANSKAGGDWPVSDKAWAKLIDLCVDICRRNGISKLVWTGDASGSLTCHYMFAATACPGPYLKARMPKLAKAVNDRLGEARVGWIRQDGKWYLFDKDGWMLVGWQKKDGRWYHLASDGGMDEGWLKDGGYWYYLEPGHGHMRTGWIKVGKKDYYLHPKKDGIHPEGSMVVGPADIDGKHCEFGADGALVL